MSVGRVMGILILSFALEIVIVGDVSAACDALTMLTE